MEPTGAWDSILQQGPLVAFMAIIIWGGAKYLRDMLSKAEEREIDREKRYNDLVETLIKVQGEQVGSLMTALKANTNVMERVERKLENDRNYTKTN